jgi:hypothetical protein
VQHVAEEDCRVLLELYGELERVLRDNDWMALADVDKAIREQLLVLARQHDLSEETRKARHRLKLLHGQAYQACSEECERLRRVLLSHLEYAEGRTAYRQVSGS